MHRQLNLMTRSAWLWFVMLSPEYWLLPPFTHIQEGYNASQESLISHRLMADLYARERDHTNAIKISETGLQLAARVEQDIGRPLKLQVLVAFILTLN